MLIRILSDHIMNLIPTLLVNIALGNASVFRLQPTVSSHKTMGAVEHAIWFLMSIISKYDIFI